MTVNRQAQVGASPVARALANVQGPDARGQATVDGALKADIGPSELDEARRMIQQPEAATHAAGQRSLVERYKETLPAAIADTYRSDTDPDFVPSARRLSQEIGQAARDGVLSDKGLLELVGGDGIGAAAVAFERLPAAERNQRMREMAAAVASSKAELSMDQDLVRRLASAVDPRTAQVLRDRYPMDAAVV